MGASLSTWEVHIEAPKKNNKNSEKKKKTIQKSIKFEVVKKIKANVSYKDWRNKNLEMCNRMLLFLKVTLIFFSPNILH